MTTQTKTAEKTQAQNIAQDQPKQGNQQVAKLQPPRMPYHPIYEERYGIDGMAWRALVDAVYPSAKTPEGIILAVSYCKAKGYDVMKKMVHVVPIWSTSLGREVEGIWEGVSALRATAFRTNEYAGCDETKFGPIIKKHFEGEVGRGQYAKQVEMDLEFPEWAQVTVYRLVQGVRCAFPGPKVYWMAAYGCQGKSDVPNDKWSEGGGAYMLEKCAEAAALRKAFPEALGGVNAAEEMEGRRSDATGPIIDHEPPADTPPRPTRESVKRDQEQARKAAYEQERQFRETMREDERTTNDAEASQEGQEAGEAAEQTASGQDGAQGQSQASEAAGAGPGHQQEPVDYTPLFDDLAEKVHKASTRKFLDGMINSRAQDIDLLRTDAPQLHAQLMTAIDDKRKWFAR